MTDASGERTWFNQRWLDYTGASPEEVKGWGWQKVHHPDHVQRVVTGIAHSFATGEPWEDTFPLLGKDGEYRWFLSRALPVRSANGMITGWLGTNTDITERKATEEERILLLEREHVAREQAEAALRTRDNFFASITHDLKNPLGAVKGYAQLLKRRLARDISSPAAWLIEGLERIESNADRTASLIEELLDLVRYREAGRLELHRTEFDLVGLCRALIDEQRRAGYRHEFELIANVPQLVGSWDRSRLERVLVNLLENAIKYSPNGGRVVMKVDRQPEPGGSYAVISISDQGVGIPTADLPRIFDQFHRAANVAEQIGGTGIGLTSVQQIVEAHGGTVAVESREGLGSTFTVTLPA